MAASALQGNRDLNILSQLHQIQFLYKRPHSHAGQRCSALISFFLGLFLSFFPLLAFFFFSYIYCLLSRRSFSDNSFVYSYIWQGGNKLVLVKTKGHVRRRFKPAARRGERGRWHGLSQPAAMRLWRYNMPSRPGRWLRNLGLRLEARPRNRR